MVPTPSDIVGIKGVIQAKHLKYLKQANCSINPRGIILNKYYNCNMHYYYADIKYFLSLMPWRNVYNKLNSRIHQFYTISSRE